MRALPWRHVPHGQAVLWLRVVPTPDVDGGGAVLAARWTACCGCAAGAVAGAGARGAADDAVSVGGGVRLLLPLMLLLLPLPLLLPLLLLLLPLMPLLLPPLLQLLLLLLPPQPLLPTLLQLPSLLLLRLQLGDAVVALGAACEGGSLFVSTPAGVAGVSVRSSGVEEVEVGAVGIGKLSGVVSESGGGAVSH